MHAPTATLTSISECLRSWSETSAFSDGVSAFCIDFEGDCSTLASKLSIFCNQAIIVNGGGKNKQSNVLPTISHNLKNKIHVDRTFKYQGPRMSI